MVRMADSKVDRAMVKEMEAIRMEARVMVPMDKVPHKMVLPSHNPKAITMEDKTRGLGINHLMGNKDLMVARDKETDMDSKAPMVVRDNVVVDMEDGVMPKVVRAPDLDVIKEIAQKAVATEVEAVVAMIVVAMIVVDMTAAVDTNEAEEVHLLVWEVVTVVATKITVALESMVQRMKLVSKTTRTTIPFLWKDCKRNAQFRRSPSSSSKLASSR